MRTIELFEKDNTYSLRGLCMLAIIAHHLYQWTAVAYGVQYSRLAYVIFQNAGYLATSVFFLLSGYGLSLSLWKKKVTLKSALGRIGKLYEPFLFYYLIGVLICITTGSINWPTILTGLATLDLPVSGGGKWFIVSILGFYIIEIIASALRIGHKEISLLIFVITCLYIGIQISILKYPTVWYNSLLAFPVGVMCAAWNNKLKILRRWGTIVFFLACIFIVCFFLSVLIGTPMWHFNKEYAEPYLMNITGVSFSLLLVVIVSIVNMSNKTLRYIGVHSFSLFMAHLVLVTFADRISNVIVYIIVVFVGSFALTFAYTGLKKLIIRLQYV